MGLLTASVGRRGANRKQDVQLVAFLLNRVILQIYPPTATDQDGRIVFEAVIRTIPPDGGATDDFYQVIGDYQRNILGFRHPDYRIDPGRRTIRALARSFNELGGVIALSTEEAMRVAKPHASYNRKHGALYQTGIVKSGQIIAGLDGSRLILDINASQTVFLLLDTAGPGSEVADMNPMRGQVGKVYRQRTEAFLDERDSMFYHDLAQRLQGVKVLVELEIGIMLAILSGTSTIGFIAVTGATVVQFVIENHQNFPKWASAVSTMLTVRQTLKKYAPTLYEKMWDGLFIGVKRGVVTAAGFAGDDVLGNVPEAMAKDPMTAGKLIGALIAGLGKAAMAKRLTIFGAVLSLLKSLATKAALAVPGAIGITANEKIAAARDMVAKLQVAGVLITEAEARAIIDEVERNAREVQGALEDLARTFSQF